MTQMYTLTNTLHLDKNFQYFKTSKLIFVFQKCFFVEVAFERYYIIVLCEIKSFTDIVHS